MAPGLGYGSSGYSTGFLRAYYSFDETMHLALDGIDAYHNWGEVLHLNDISSTPPSIRYKLSSNVGFKGCCYD
jgi:hypothetical protein